MFTLTTLDAPAQRGYAVLLDGVLTAVLYRQPLENATLLSGSHDRPAGTNTSSTAEARTGGMRMDFSGGHIFLCSGE